MAVPAHIRIARAEGDMAGFEAYRGFLSRSGLPLVQEQLQALKAKGNKAQQFKYYCSMFDRQLHPHGKASTTRKAPARRAAPASTPPAPDTDGQTELLAKLAEALGMGVAPAVVTQVAAPARQHSRGNTGTTDRDVYRPRDESKPANGNQLWKLNMLGGFGEVITAGEAFDRIAQLLD